MWYLRIWPGVRQHFRPRWVEWVMAVWITVWSANMLMTPGNDFLLSDEWTGLAYWFGWDWLFCTITASAGIARLAALVVNGTFHDTVYARYSPLVRSTMAFLGCGAWMMIWMSSTSASTQGAVVYWAPALIDGFIAYYVGGEFGTTLRNFKDGRTDRDR